MSMRGAGTHLIPMAQTRVDGGTPHPETAIPPGAQWRWFGDPVRIDGPGAVLFLHSAVDHAHSMARSYRAVRKLFHRLGLPMVPRADADEDDVGREDHLIVSDGVRFYAALPITGPSDTLYVFDGPLPPAETDLMVVQGVGPAPRPPIGKGMPGLAPHTSIAVPGGSTPVQDLRPGDLVLTRDNGPQPLRWSGARRVSAEEMHADQRLRPVRLRAGALARGHPQKDLLVAPDHGVLLDGPHTEALFAEREVFVRARDLVEDHMVFLDHAVRGTHYMHLLFDRHEVIVANGVAVESLHPGSADLSGLTPAERLAMGRAVGDLTRYGPPARRTLSGAEHAILRSAHPPHYLA